MRPVPKAMPSAVKTTAPTTTSKRAPTNTAHSTTANSTIYTGPSPGPVKPIQSTKQFDHTSSSEIVSDPSESSTETSELGETPHVTTHTNAQDRKQFDQYCRWATQELNIATQGLLDAIEQLDGDVDDGLKQLIYEHSVNRKIMAKWDGLSRSVKEMLGEAYRKIHGITEGYPVQKGKDILNPWGWFRIYPVWAATQYARATTGLMYAAMKNPAVAAVNLYVTTFSAVPYFLHVTTQVRSHFRAKEEIDRAYYTALACLEGAKRYAEDANASFADANAYRLAMQNYRYLMSPVNQLEGPRLTYALAREALLFGNWMLGTLTLINLTNKFIESNLAAGLIQGGGGLLALGQAFCDVVQGVIEQKTADLRKHGAETKYFEALGKSRAKGNDGEFIPPIVVEESDVETIIIEKDESGGVGDASESHSGDNSSETGIDDAGYVADGPSDKLDYAKYWQELANNGYASYHERQIGNQYWERIFGWVRVAKGCGSAVPALYATVFGASQIFINNKATYDGLFGQWPLQIGSASIAWSGAYFSATSFKMGPVRAGEATKIKKLHRRAQHLRVKYTPKKRGELYNSGQAEFYDGYKRMFQSGHALRRGEAKKEKFASLRGNEFVFLDLVSEDIFSNLQVKSVSELMQMPVIRWMVSTAEVAESELKASLHVATRRAPIFRTDFLKQAIAKLLNIKFPVGPDGLEQRIKPEILVQARIGLFESMASQSDDLVDASGLYGDPEAYLDECYRRAPDDWTAYKDRMLQGVTLEEFIASVLHVRDRSHAKEVWSERRYKFARLMAIAEYAKEERFNALNAVYLHNRSTLDEALNDKDGLEAFSGAVMEYRDADIFDREGQYAALKKLATMKVMQEVLAYWGNNPQWLIDDPSDFAYGVGLLCDRVDRVELSEMQFRVSNGHGNGKESEIGLQEVIVDGGDGDEVGETSSSQYLDSSSA